MSEIKRDAIAHRIRSLLAKTVENGCTEEEAILAAQKARELMDHYRLSMTDVEIQAEPVDRIEIDRGYQKQAAAVDYCMSGIAKYCGVKMWFSMRGTVRVATVFGLKSDVEMARYLYEMLRDCIKAEKHVYFVRNLKRSPLTSRQRLSAVNSFQVGMATRINERLIDMARALDSTAQTGSGTALVVVKNAVVDDAFAKLGINFRRSAKGMSARDGAAYAAGSEAGSRINLNRPVTGPVTGGRLA